MLRLDSQSIAQQPMEHCDKNGDDHWGKNDNEAQGHYASSVIHIGHVINIRCAHSIQKPDCRRIMLHLFSARMKSSENALLESIWPKIFIAWYRTAKNGMAGTYMPSKSERYMPDELFPMPIDSTKAQRPNASKPIKTTAFLKNNVDPRFILSNYGI